VKQVRVLKIIQTMRQTQMFRRGTCLVLAAFLTSVFVMTGMASPQSAAKTSAAYSDTTWQIAQVTPRRKPGDENRAAPTDKDSKPVSSSDREASPAPAEIVPRARPSGNELVGDYVWNEKDRASRGRQQAVLGIVIKVLAGSLLALSVAMVFWTMSWRSGAVLFFTFTVWIFEFRSILIGFETGFLAFLVPDHAALALMGLAATVMINAVLGRHVPRNLGTTLFIVFGGLFAILFVTGLFAPEAVESLTRVLVLTGGVAILIYLIMTLGRAQGRSFSFGLLLVALSIFAAALSPLLINTGANADGVAPAILWLHVVFLIATFFINIPTRLSNAYGENFPLPSGPHSASGPHFDRAAPSFSNASYSEDGYEEYDESDDYDDYETERREDLYRDEEEYEEVDETLEDEDRYALGVAAAHQGIWDWNIEYDELYLSPSVDAMLGLATGGLTRTEVGWAERVHPDDFDAYRNALRTYLRRGNVAFDIEFRMLHEDSSYVWLQLRATCLPDASGVASRCIGTLADVSQSRASEDRMLRSASVDPLTGLINRPALYERINEALGGGGGGMLRSGRPGLIIIDLDRFKTVNDSLGHSAGDILLQTVAKRLEDVVGHGGLVARLGSDEFAILTDGSGGSARVVADSALKALALPLELEGYEVFPMASFGLAEAGSQHHKAEDLLKDAETAMFRAKRTGGGCVEVFESHMMQQSVEALSLETDLRRALERRQMEVLFQPIMSLQNESIAGFEALLRWRHPVRGLMTPDQFVAMAEETDMIVPLGRFVLSMASQQLAHWHRVFPVSPPLFVSVNVSSRQLKRPDFADDVREALKEANLMPGTLKLEVTETLIMEDPHLAERLLGEIKSIGAGIVLDDFGTGFASLSNLQRYPFDTIKVDRSFVSTMNSRPDSHVIVNSIVNLANDLRLTVIAEGLESEDDTFRLRQMGCHFGQGYVFGEPMSAQDAQTFIAQHWHDMRGI
jgi:diguanylate cyclase (GGDEF)-like protein